MPQKYPPWPKFWTCDIGQKFRKSFFSFSRWKSLYLLSFTSTLWNSRRRLCTYSANGRNFHSFHLIFSTIRELRLMYKVVYFWNCFLFGSFPLKVFRLLLSAQMAHFHFELRAPWTSTVREFVWECNATILCTTFMNSRDFQTSLLHSLGRYGGGVHFGSYVR